MPKISLEKLKNNEKSLPTNMYIPFVLKLAAKQLLQPQEYVKKRQKKLKNIVENINFQFQLTGEYSEDVVNPFYRHLC